MEWMTTIRTAIQFMEDNLLSIRSIEEVAKASNISTMYLQQGFTILTNVNLSEYIRNRRLYKAAMELSQSDKKIIDIAFKYGYETPESFTKAFVRFHGATPLAIKKNASLIKTFLPFSVSLKVRGGTKMDYTVEKMNPIKLVGFAKEFSSDEGFTKVPLFWDEILAKYGTVMNTKNKENITNFEQYTEIEKAILQNDIGPFAVCIDNIGKPGKFKYLIAGKLNENSCIAKNGLLPELETYEIPELTWAKFKCIGKIPESMQAVYTNFWNEWLPNNQKYELVGELNVEYYPANCEAEIWMPVKEK